MEGLSVHIKDHYKLVGITPGKMIINGETVDFRNISLDKANALFNSGCEYLKKVTAPAELKKPAARKKS